MAGTYVPPHARKTNANSDATDMELASEATEESSAYTIQEIYHHYWPGSTVVQKFSPRKMDIPAVLSATINGSKKDTDNVVFLMLHKDANPRWKDVRILFMKSRLPNLPWAVKNSRQHRFEIENWLDDQLHSDAEEITDSSVQNDIKENAASSNEHDASSDAVKDEVEENGAKTASLLSETVDKHTLKDCPTPPSTSDHLPVAVFEGNGVFKFVGYFKFVALDLVQPGTPAMEKMLLQKWGNRKRGKSDWGHSVRTLWAVAKLEPCAVNDEVLPAPKIEKLVKERGSRNRQLRDTRSVNEQLREMRLRDGRET